jgi:hypothetical protein
VVEHDPLEAAGYLPEHSANINEPTEGEGPLTYVVMRNHVQSVQLPVNACANVQHQNTAGQTIRETAIKRGQPVDLAILELVLLNPVHSKYRVITLEVY